DMTVEQAVEFFANQPKILRKIKTLNDVGLGYITLGQHATTLSGGEAQRVKLASELSKKDTGKTFYILDEPTTGLHFQDIDLLMGVLQKLVEKGNTVLVIEHNLDVIKMADYVVDLGPEGGNAGGSIVVSGTPEKVAAHPQSHTGKFLALELNRSN
ncbi:MAG: ATP-binding cassette domain-containing protein, partial [Cytophagales bacterium]